ncbi:Pancreatic lipase-related protein 2 [Acropora cervicornis]|uniref:Pancreatic lipase-related protein 2 n=1 Tax=Acropora cervicornis TaxID=6130 RepID=A0AAD9Q8X7_ACRCE|nr:Pancreatic lipase-related protein 2 [Acropora cervicornis]
MEDVSYGKKNRRSIAAPNSALQSYQLQSELIKCKFNFKISFPLVSTAVTVCYDKYGCFSDDPPFDNLLMALPSHPDSIDTSFVLYTNTNALNTREILAGEYSSISNSSFNPMHKVALIIHGFTQSGKDDWVKEMAGELLKKEQMNVIVVDWGQGSSMSTPYQNAAGNARLIGVQVALLIDVLSQEFNVSLEKFHIVGHSLGAHVGGFAAEKLRENGKLIGRITGMDPAGPGFEIDNTAARLDQSDAMFVDIIHTDVREGLLDMDSFGLKRPCGHVDFYPNEGQHQPGCEATNVVANAVDSYLENGQVSFHWLFGCNHMKSIAYFTASINNACTMTAFPCDNWDDFREGKCFFCQGDCPQMGYGADSYRGAKPVNLFLTTEENLFCVGDHYFSVTLLSDEQTQPSAIFQMLDNTMKIKLSGVYGDVETYEKRSVNAGNSSFALSSSQDIGKLLSITLEFQGSGFYLNDVIVYSVADNKRY